MFDLDLVTNDGKYLLGCIYSEYIKRRKDNVPKKTAIYFKDPEDIHKNFMSGWLLDDVITTCLELHQKGFINGTRASNSILNVSISSEAIALLEKTFSDKAEEVLGWLSKIKSAIPFI
ncbi:MULTISPECIES: hypothetical protein [Aerococcus]|uniref:hypothetical protein n=1 Tax=Aerococcus TaxID=1375 RepID=UPI000DCF48CB|nr:MULTISPECIES: hypothetical protein [Aerococcus]KAA9231688.1 hypothetical protein F6I37_08710 [Aerococcus mictus]MDK6290890.1 hypothetical protein [Aerococcus urinae]MDK6374741.1 hypothetical protein [Aerococcus urinae]MDK6420234.1 hypothetical protein [Aerococcus urinae]MDK8074616.1 hypothetical protein [Aerococcus urinae]